MRRALLVGFLVLGCAIILQTSIIGRMMLLSGSADIVLLILAAWGLQERSRGAWFWGAIGGILVGMVSGVPMYIFILGYLAVIGMASLLKQRIWQAPLLAMFIVTFIGTLVLLFLTFVDRTLFWTSPPFNNVFTLIILPSVLLNLIMAIPVYAVIQDLVKRVYPMEVGI
jgi:cell shape-determining protein MreD